MYAHGNYTYTEHSAVHCAHCTSCSTKFGIEQAQAMKQVLGIRDEKMRMKATPPLAVAPITQDDGMRWNPK